MIILVHKAHGSLERHAHPNVGRLLSPRDYSRAADTAASGLVWAADNDAFNGFHAGRYFAMLDALVDLPGCRFVTAPDVVADASATDRLYGMWRLELIDRRLPIGFVAQDGCEDVPWGEIAAIFIGGSTEWKLSREAAGLVEMAKAHEMWAHMGRVNTYRRLEYAKAIGCDSVDGTQFSMFTDRWLPAFAERAGAPDQGIL